MQKNDDSPASRSERVAEIILVSALIILSVAVRFNGLTEQGLRFHDEGTYCQFGRTLLYADPAQGRPVFYKHGTAVLMHAAFKLFGHGDAPGWLLSSTDATGLLMNAFFGVATVLLAWYTVRRLAGPLAALGTASACAAMPYMLFYQRSAMTEAAYFFLSLAAFTLALLGLERIRSDGQEATPTLHFIGAGIFAGFGFAANAPAALICALVLLGAAVHVYAGRAAFRHIPVIIVASLVGFICGAFMPKLICSPYIPDETAFSPTARLGNILAFNPRLLWAEHLVRYAGPPALILAIIGGIHIWKTRHHYRLLLLIPTGGLLMFYAQTDMTWPRLFFPLVLPVVLLAGFGAAAIAGRFAKSKARRWAIVTTLAAVTAAFGVWRSIPIIRLQSGYREANNFLAQDNSNMAITFHGWTILRCLTNRSFVADTGEELIADLFEDDKLDRLPDRLEWFTQKYGSTHLVIDYFFWKQLRSKAARRRFADYLDTNPPDKTIPNPVAAHRPTLAEDSEAALDILEDENARFIYIWRLPQ